HENHQLKLRKIKDFNLSTSEKERLAKEKYEERLRIEEKERANRTY
ncbi:2932_t:CDS:2, partial [Cetraspora pellucida]